MSNLVNQLLEDNTQLEEGVIADYFKGVDDEALDAAKAAAARQTMPRAEKERILNEIDDAIDNSNRIFTTSTLGKTLTNNLSSLLTPLLPLVYIGVRLSTSAERKAYREQLYDLRSVIKKIKTSD